ncbi:hypothetical protein MRX96_023466 [Rhipicephalus microplus]
MRPRNNLLLYVLQILALCLGLSSDGWSPESLLPVILSPDANQRSPEFRCTDEFSWIRWPAQVSVSGALNYTVKSTATSEASRYAPHVFSGIGQGFTASMRPRNNLLLYVLQILALCLGLSSDGWSPESLLPVILSPDANQRSPEFRCTDEFSWIRWPAQVSVSGGCRFMGHSLRNGESLALIQPCVRVICLLNGLGLRLRTCPFQTGQSVDVAGLGQASPVAYPHCCERCRAIR